MQCASALGKDVLGVPSKRTPHKRFSKMISLDAKNLESVLLTELHVAVQIAEPKALNLEKDYLAGPWNVGSFRICPCAPGRIRVRRWPT